MCRFYNAPLALGMAVFLFAKLFIVLAQTSAMGMPRLGDDSYVHLWRAEQVGIVGPLNTMAGKPDIQSRGVRDIREFCAPASTDMDSDSAKRCARAADNTIVPDVKAGSSLILHVITKAGLTPKWSYALYESLIATIIVGGLAIFLARLYGPVSAGLGLVFMAFLTLLPPQGLHQFIPSTLTIGLSLGLLGIAATSASWRTYLFAVIACAAFSMIHPVAMVFDAGLIIVGFLSFVREKNAKFALYGAAVAGAAVAAVIFVSDTVRGAVFEAISTNFAENVLTNAGALPSWLGSFAEKNPGITAAILVSLVVNFAWLRKKPSRPVWTVGAALLVLAVASLLHKTVFFTFDIPLDLFSRIFVAIAALACGFLASVMIDLLGTRPLWGQAAVVVLAAAVAAPSAFQWSVNILSDANGRPEVVDAPALRAAISALPSDTTLAYGELDLTLDAAFVAGAYKLGAIPLPGLQPDRLAAALSERQPQVMILPNFRSLNFLAAMRSDSFETRRHGFPSSEIDIVAIDFPTPTLSSAYLLLQNAGLDGVVMTPAIVTEARQRRQLPGLFVAPGEKKWFHISAGDAGPVRSMFFNMSRPGLWVLGASVNEPARQGVNWPWDANAQILWHLRGTPTAQISGIQFNPRLLLGHWRTPLPTDGKLVQGMRVINDESGLVMLQTGYLPARSP